MNYSDQYRHPKWQKRRLEIMELSGFRCEQCGNDQRQLHVHHTHYRKRAKVWDYDDASLVCLCSECHEELHQAETAVAGMFGRLTGATYKRVAGYAAAQSLREPGGLGGVFGHHFEDEEFLMGFLDGVGASDLDRAEAVIRRALEKGPGVSRETLYEIEREGGGA